MKRIAVIIATTELPRMQEALRAAVGLSLRGDRVCAWLCTRPPNDPLVQRALATLQALGHEVAVGQSAWRLHDCDAVEVWS